MTRRASALECASLLALWILFALLLAGCRTPHDTKTTSNQPLPIDTLVLLSAPAAVDLDPSPGPDGIAVRIYGTSETKTRSLPLNNGNLDVLMFDGVINDKTPATVKPLHVWSHTIAEIQPFATKTAIGVSYPLTLPWGQDRPRQETITIVARYVAPDGRTIYSAPSTIPVGNPRP